MIGHLTYGLDIGKERIYFIEKLARDYRDDGITQVEAVLLKLNHQFEKKKIKF